MPDTNTTENAATETVNEAVNTAPEPTEVVVPAETPADTPKRVTQSRSSKIAAAKAAKAAEEAAKAAGQVAEVPEIEAAVQTAADTSTTQPDPALEAQSGEPPASVSEIQAESPAETPTVKPGHFFQFGQFNQQQSKSHDSLILKIKNNGAASFELYTRTALPAGQVTTITCTSLRQRDLIVSKLNTLNKFAGANRYVIED
ncbi:hypothetical protein [Acinetobacter sp. 272263]|uniref:hypothetical protein n=1 Tax=Acinetobacter sp. 272263 TaxID=1310639 RepID=UPI0004512D06|nr:hypothetical protein [Acinetobacter sp. 272263]EXB84779.1 hypothetical protein J538_1855 [Acinetobacter sp. 272263]